ncbi:MAG: exonuclease domain-containing protein [Patescibacteria group bacterium]|nr:exonuclease domain-containing protein [Patescibacteria group bacterium]
MSVDDLYIIVDIETTGPSPQFDSIIEIGAVKVSKRRIVEKFHTLVWSDAKIPQYVRKLTGITEDMLVDAPSYKDALQDFIRFTGGGTLVAHNAHFDLKFIKKAIEFNGLPVLENRFLCTIKLSRMLIEGPTKFGLDTLAEHLNIEVSDRHRALGDAETTAKLFCHLMDILKDKEAHFVDDVLFRASRADGPSSKDLQPKRDLAKKLPQLPGVYIMKNIDGNVIYVGKAVNLRRRVRSYFTNPAQHSRKITSMLMDIEHIDYYLTGSELEALILESKLIKKYLPIYNRRQLNYENYAFLRIDVNEAFPRFSCVKEIQEDGAKYLGPFGSPSSTQIAIDAVNDLFGLRRCSQKLEEENDHIPCMYYHIGKCTSPCSGNVSAKRYNRNVEKALKILAANGKEILTMLVERRNRLSDELRFEEASVIQERIVSIQSVLRRQSTVTSLDSEKNFAAIVPSYDNSQALIFFVRNGKLKDRLLVDLNKLNHTGGKISDMVTSIFGQPENERSLDKEGIDELGIILSWIYRNRGLARIVSLSPGIKGHRAWKKILIALSKPPIDHNLQRVS